MKISINITIASQAGTQPQIIPFLIDLSSTPQLIIDTFHAQGLLESREEVSMFEVRQHEKKRFVRRCLSDEFLMVLLFNWNLSSHQYTLVLRKKCDSIYLDLRKELSRTLPLESLLLRQAAIKKAEDGAIHAVGQRVDHQKSLILKRIQDIKKE